MTNPRLPDLTPDAPTPSAPRVRVSVDITGQSLRVVDGVNCLVIVGMSRDEIGITNNQIGVSSPAQASALLAAAISIVRRDYGANAVNAALDLERAGVKYFDASPEGP